MRRWLAVLIVLAFGALVGCASSDKKRSTARSYGPSMPGLIGDDVVYVDVAVIERTLGDAFLNRELWSEADEEVVHVESEPAVSLERKTALEKNGFRIGQIGGLLPSKLQDLLTSERHCRARRIQLHADHATILPCGIFLPTCHFRLVRDDRSARIEFEKANCQLEVIPSLTDEGRIRLSFTPHILHGDMEPNIVAIREADGQLRWERQVHQAEEIYSWLSWTLTVVPNEYVVLGALLDNGDTMGEQFFLTREEEHPIVQRLLVLRATHVPTPVPENLGPSSPLALRANLITARGSSD
ncbi:MAG: hypothetical protein ACYC3I_15860 [Gemmataceae bacterium]